MPRERLRLRRLPARPLAAGLAAVRARRSCSCARAPGRSSSRTTGACGTTSRSTLGVRYEYQSPYWEAAEPPRQPRRDARLHRGRRRAGGRGRAVHRARSRRRSSSRTATTSRRASASRGGRTRTTVVRGGYGINYASVPYLSFAQRLASQPPFAVTDTRPGHASRRRCRWRPRSRRADRATTTNNFGVDRNYRLGYVQIWNADVQRELGRTLSLGGAYTGHEGVAARPPARAEPRADRPADRRRPAVHLGVVGRAVRSCTRCRSACGGAWRRASLAAAPTRSSKSMDNASTIGGGAGGGRAERPGPRGRVGPVQLRPAPPPQRRLQLRAAVRAEPPLAQQESGWHRRRRRLDPERQRRGRVRAAVHGARDRATPPTSPRAPTARCGPTTPARRSRSPTRRSSSSSTRPRSRCRRPGRSATRAGTPSSGPGPPRSTWR